MLQFTKVQGAGNDFVLIETGGAGRDWAGLARAMCHRRYGVGADGLLLLLSSDRADFGMRVFNPDGSEAEACGNGLRCLARYILEKKSPGSHHFSIETRAGLREVRVSGMGGTRAIQVGMGRPVFAAEDIPAAVGGWQSPILDYTLTVEGQGLSVNLVSMGNPHAVFFNTGPVAGFPLDVIGPAVERHRTFPERTNFEVARLVNRREIEARVWERGVGETPACGTGACAIAVIAHLRGYADSPVEIKMPGGTLNVEWDGRGEVYLSGPAEIVFTGEWPE